MLTYVKSPEVRAEAIRLYESGMTQTEVAAKIGVHPRSVLVWMRKAGVSARPSRSPDPMKRGQAACLNCEGEFEYLMSQTRGKYCSDKCRLTHLTAESLAHNFICPCGTKVDTAVRTKRKYCSSECRAEYAPRRGKDPSKWVVFNCGTCGVEVERRRSYGGGSGANRFCSNACAARHTKTVRHYMARDSDVVLDSTWEMLVYGLLSFLRIPVERFDRAEVVEWAEGRTYGPDFHLPVHGLWIEVKGQEDYEDPLRWAAFRDKVGPLAVLGSEDLDRLRSLDRDAVIATLTKSSYVG